MIIVCDRQLWIKLDYLLHFVSFKFLAINWCRRLRRSLVDAAGFDPEPIQFGPQRLHSLRRIAIEITSADTNKLPAGTLKIALAGHVLFIPFRAVPLVAVTFHGQASLHAFDNQVNPITVVRRIPDAHLRLNVVAFLPNSLENVLLKR